MMIMTNQIEDILGQKVQSQLEQPLSGLQSGAQLFFKHEKGESFSTRIRLSHPEAPHLPSYNILWITEDGQFMLISPIRIDPDSDDEPSIRVLVKLVAPNAFEILQPNFVANSIAVTRQDIERKINQEPGELDRHLQCMISKYLTLA